MCNKKKQILHCMLMIGLLFGANVYAQPSGPNDAPEGMEVIQVSDGYRMIVPKGSKVEQLGSQIHVEDQGQYLFSKIRDIEKRLSDVEEKQKTIHSTLSIQRQSPEDILLDVRETMQEIMQTQKEQMIIIQDLQREIESLKAVQQAQTPSPIPPVSDEPLLKEEDL